MRSLQADCRRVHAEVQQGPELDHLSYCEIDRGCAVRLAHHSRRDNVRCMRDPTLLAVHLLVTVAKLLRPGGVRAVAAESLLLKQQIIIGNRTRHRAPNLTSLDRLYSDSSPC